MPISEKNHRDTCLYEQIAEDIVSDIKNDIYPAHHKLPSVRKLSNKLGVSISTVVQAYSTLEDRGYIIAKPQSGYFVRSDVIHHQEQVSHVPPLSKGDLPGKVTKSQQIQTMLAQCQNPAAVNFGAAIPALELLPVNSIQLHLQKASRFHKSDVLSYQFSPGYLKLRAAIAQRMRHIGVRCQIDDIVITQGCTEALSLSLRCNTQVGDMIAVESPCYYGFLQMAENFGLKVIEIPTDTRKGMSIDALKLALQQWPIKLVMLGSRFSNPTGSVMSTDNQKQLVALAEQHHFKIIEDDIYGEIDFTGKHNTVLKSFDQTGCVMYCSSFSKTVAPGLRIGWCIPGASKEHFIQLQMFNTFSVSSISQVAMASFLQTGHYDKHLRKLKKNCRHNVDSISALIRDHFPREALFSVPEGGFVIWVSLPENVNSQMLQKLARERNISLLPGSVFSKTEHFDNYIRINCALTLTETVKNALIELGDIITCLQEERDDMSR